MTRLWTTPVLYDPNPAPTGGGAQAPEPAPTGGGAPAPTPAPEPKPVPDPRAARIAAYDKYQLTDTERAEADKLNDYMDGLDHAQRAALLKRMIESQRPADKRTQRKEDAPDEPDEPEDPRDRKLREQAERLERLEKRLQAEDARRDTVARKGSWRTEVKAAIEAAPALAEQAQDAEALNDLAAEALGWVSDALQDGKFGGSRQAALTAWIEKQTARAARHAGQGVKEFVASKLAALKAQTETGGGRPPAEIQKTYTPADLEGGKILQDALADLK